MENLPKWQQNFIIKNNELWENNKEFLSSWLPKAKQNKNFFGAKAKLEWQVGNINNPNIWDHIMQIRPSGLRVKPGTYFPALVAITQTSIVGKRKRFLTPRECARLQSFPDTFRYDNKKHKHTSNLEIASMLDLLVFSPDICLGIKNYKSSTRWRCNFHQIGKN